MVIADLVQPATPAAHALAAKAWDEAVRRRSLELAGGLAPYEEFGRRGWNLYAIPEPDPIDHPSPLFDQLRWLSEAGLTGVDVYWMQAGHADVRRRSRPDRSRFRMPELVSELH